ncbi:hypothetical protein [Allorhizobium undicola]|uniref:hypothetical protein n=1 Tax=Allorhizobium undicola TaxID=78527 RepID=UPI0012B5C276|nr:hypothetical protein [Allorhizobium undicola]
MQEIMRLHEEDLAATRRALEMMDQIRESLRLQQTEDDTPIPLARAVCHPILGGILRRDPSGDVPGPSFTENSLRLAISKGHLECTWVAGKQYVTPAALRAWLATTDDQRKPEKRTVIELTTRPKTLREKRQGNASVESASAKLLSMKVALAKKKGK